MPQLLTPTSAHGWIFSINRPFIVLTETKPMLLLEVLKRDVNADATLH